MPITISKLEYIEGISLAPSRLLIDRASWENTPAGMVVRDVIERFITPKCYLIIPGEIADGIPVSLSIGENDAPGYRCISDVLSALAAACDYRWHITLDGRIHFGPIP